MWQQNLCSQGSLGEGLSLLGCDAVLLVSGS